MLTSCDDQKSRKYSEYLSAMWWKDNHAQHIVKHLGDGMYGNK